MPPDTLPLQPLEYRQIVGLSDERHYRNPTGETLYPELGLRPEDFDAVFDFGCGCGRTALNLIGQQPRPRRYVGIDVNRGMIDWCRENITPLDPAFQFIHHDVYAPSTPRNTLRLADRFPVEDGAFSLVIGHSIFTHLLPG